MPQPDPAVLLTRPIAAARRFAATLPGVRVVIAPLQRIVPVAHDAALLRAARGVVLTSPEAVPAAGPGAGRLALCVGEATAEAARAEGFAVEVGLTGEASGLLPLIAAAPVPLIHPHGRHVARALPVPGMVVYEQVAQPLTQAARALLAGTGPVIVPLFSPRSAGLAAEALRGARAPLRVQAISPATAAAWGGAAEVALRPDAAAMRGLVLAAWAAAASAAAKEQTPREPG